MLRLRRLIFVSACVIIAPVLAAQEMHRAARSTAAFDQMKTLAGEWQGKDSGGKPVKVTYTVVSNGSVVMEHLQPGKEAEMITMYTRDGDRMVVTHYCSAGNQPTMQTAPLTSATGKYDFSFVRASGMKSPDEGHMTALSLAISDKDHLAQTWTFLENGKSAAETFNFTRVK
jgi:hypothetical protein